MSLTVTHAKVSAIADDPAASAAGEVLPSDWNAAHIVTGAMSVFNVADFGAVGNGVSDDTTEIQAALDAANAAGGGVVWVPPGTYKISNSLIVYSNTHVRGAGRGATTLRGTAGAYSGKTINGGSSIYCTIAMVSASRSSVKSLTVDHATNSTTANGIAIQFDGTETPSNMCVIEDCEVLGYDSHQYLIWNYMGVGSKIINNYIDGGVTSRDGTVGQEGIESYGGVDVLISGNTIKNINQYGIYLWGDTDSGPPTSFTVSNNYLSVCHSGIRVAANAYNIRVFGNHCDDCWEAGIKVTCSSTTKLDDVGVFANTVDTADIGIYLISESGGTTSRILVDGNSVNNTDSTTSAGIYVFSFSKFNVYNNTIKNSSGHGIYFEECSYAMACNNIIDTVEKIGIYCYAVSKAQILGNEILEYNNGSGGDPGIQITASDNIFMDHNSFKWTHGSYTINVTSSASDRCIVGKGNQLLQNSYNNPTYRNSGTNPNRGTVSLSAAATTTTVYNTLVNPSSQISINQTAGTIKAFIVNNVGHGAFDLVTAAAAGDETFAYEIA